MTPDQAKTPAGEPSQGLEEIYEKVDASLRRFKEVRIAHWTAINDPNATEAERHLLTFLWIRRLAVLTAELDSHLRSAQTLHGLQTQSGYLEALAKHQGLDLDAPLSEFLGSFGQHQDAHSKP